MCLVRSVVTKSKNKFCERAILDMQNKLAKLVKIKINKTIRSGKINIPRTYGKLFETKFSKFVGNKYSVAI